MVGEFTLVCPFYRNCEMLREQMRNWEQYPDGIHIIVVDDGSPEHALPILTEASASLLKRLELYRITVDIPWNRGGARNLGSKVASTDWIVHIDIDHVMTPESAKKLLTFEASPKHWYRFERFRKGRADETRKKDKIPDSEEFGKIHPHIDSYLCSRTMYWKAGGYNESFSGCLGGGSPFLKELGKCAPVHMAPADIVLHVYTRDVCLDASVSNLSRDTAEFSRRKNAMRGNFRGTNPLRFPWERVL